MTDLPNDGRITIGFCLDESSSMGIVYEATISGFNEYLATLRDQEGETNMTVTKFSLVAGETHRPLVENVAVKDVPELTRENYAPQGSTPLYDAIGYTIKKMANWLTEQKETWTPLFIIQTDGEENASREFTRQQVFDLIQEKEAAGWKFLYLGADQSEMQAERIGSSIGMSVGSTSGYASTTTSSSVSSLSATTSSLRSNPTQSSAMLNEQARLDREKKIAEDERKKVVKDAIETDSKRDTSTPNF